METHSSSDDMALSRDAATDQSEAFACGDGKAAGVADADADAGVAAALQDAALQHDNSLTEQSDSMETHPSSDGTALSRDEATDLSEAFGEGKDAGVADADAGVCHTGVADADADAWRIVLLGKTGVGKSSLANNIFGEAVFKINNLSDLESHSTTAETKSVAGKSITLIDTPGFFDPSRSEEQMKPEMMRCSTECAPGPHVFLIVLKVEKFIEHNEAVVSQMCDYFSQDALKYVVIVFTHGDQLPEGMTLDTYIEESGDLGDLVKKCGGRCHVVDDKYWKDDSGGDRSNRVQVEKLLYTIDQMVVRNEGRCYTDKKLREVEKKIQKEEKVLRQSPGSVSGEEIRKQARSNVLKTLVEDAAHTGWLGVPNKVWSAVTCGKNPFN